MVRDGKRFFFIFNLSFISFFNDKNKINKNTDDLKKFLKDWRWTEFDDKGFKEIINFLRKLAKKEEIYKLKIFKFIKNYIKNERHSSYDFARLIADYSRNKKIYFVDHDFTNCSFCKIKTITIADFIDHLDNLDYQLINLKNVVIETKNIIFKLIQDIDEFSYTSRYLNNCLRSNYKTMFKKYNEHLFFQIIKNNILYGAVYIKLNSKTKKWEIIEANSKNNNGIPSSLKKEINNDFINKVNIQNNFKNLNLAITNN